MTGVRAFYPQMTSLKAAASGQDVAPLYWGGPDGNMPDSQTCAVRIVMNPGKVSAPHRHDYTQVQVYLDSGGTGVLTLWGDDLEHTEWVNVGGLLVIRPGIPHLALYPSRSPEKGDHRIVVPAVATEIRSNPDWRDDIIPMPELWSRARQHVARLGLEDAFDFPRGQA